MGEELRYAFEMSVCLQCDKALCDPRYVNEMGEGFCSAKCEDESLEQFLAGVESVISAKAVATD